MTAKRTVRGKKRAAHASRPPKAPTRPRFVGREASPVLDRYPARAGAPAPPPPLSATVPGPAAPAPGGPAPAPAPAGGTASPLITLDRPFDVDEFAALLGETSIRVTVPRDALPEVLRRVLEFMGFGIYVYSISVRPAPSELLKGFIVELQRVDFSTDTRVWVPFVEKGTTSSPFGPTSERP